MDETRTTRTGAVYRKKSQGPEIWRRFRRNKRAVVGLCIILLMIFCAVFADLISPYDPTLQDIPSMLQGPSAAHLMGTDQ